MSLTNPKVIMFFMAFIPLFLSSESKPVTLFVLMMHVTVTSLIYQTGLVLVGNVVARRVSRWQYVRIVATRLAGIALISVGVKLAVSNR
ncbi:MAG: LysE family transporter [Desulforhopalus sp.]